MEVKLEIHENENNSDKKLFSGFAKCFLVSGSSETHHINIYYSIDCLHIHVTKKKTNEVRYYKIEYTDLMTSLDVLASEIKE